MDEAVQYRDAIIKPSPRKSDGEPGWKAGCWVEIPRDNKVTDTQAMDSLPVLPTREEAVIKSIELGEREIDRVLASRQIKPYQPAAGDLQADTDTSNT